MESSNIINDSSEATEPLLEKAETAEGENNMHDASSTSITSNAQQQPIPSNSRRLPPPVVLRIIFLLLGVGVLVPWNAFISAKGYYFSRICEYYHDFNIESVFATVYNLAAVFSLGCMICYEAWRDQRMHARHVNSNNDENDPLNNGDHNHNHDHSLWLVKIPFIVIILAFLLQTSMVVAISVPFFLQLTLLSIGTCGMLGGLAQAGVVATAGLFDPNISMSPYLAGQSVGGVAVSFVNFLAASWEAPLEYWQLHCGNDLRQLQEQCNPYKQVDGAVFFYFFLGSLTLTACLMGYTYVARIQHNYQALSSPGHNVIREESPPRIELAATTSEERLEERQGGDENSDRNTEEPIVNVIAEDDDEENETASVWEHVRGPAVAIFLTFVVTLSLFPGWTSELRSVRQCKSSWRLANDLYTPFSFLVFNVGDLAGRLLSAQFPLSGVRNLSKKLVYASILRFLFFPILFLCTGGTSERLHIHSDLYSEIAQVAFGVSNGFLLSSSFVHAPSLVPHTSDAQERMSSILNFAVVFGLFCGSLLSFPVSLLVN